jgi:NDP-sugar pyrophosphorylase family protein
MIGVIVLPGPTSEMHGLDAQRSLSLLPLGDRPMLQHIVESLVSQGITSIELIVGHAPEQVEALLGNGDRWGCSFRYHLEVQPERPYRSLRIITQTKTEPWVLVHAEHYPCLELPSGPVSKAVLFYGTLNGRSNGSSNGSNNGHGPTPTACVWRGTAVFPAGNWSDVFANQTPEELRRHLQQLASSDEATVVSTADWIDASTPGGLLETQTRLLDRRLDGLLISGTERHPGIWISRNVVIHPSVELIAPLYIGPNSRINRGVKLGPNAVISGECIVDTNTTIEHSLVIAGSYIGEGLELNKAVVDRNLLINVQLDTSVDILESFLLGGLKQQHRQSWFGRGLQAILALALALLFLPISLLSILYFALARRLSYASVQMVQLPTHQNTMSARTYPLPCLGADAWSTFRPAGWGAFLRQFLPGLFAVASGRLSFVGLPPRTVAEIEKLSDEWRSMYLDGKAGLITEACIASTDPDDETQLYIADAYYAARQSLLYDLKLASKYFLRLIVPAR